MGSPLEEVRLRIGSSLRHLLSGDVERRVIPTDDSWFGPGSATWEVHADASMLVGGIRALLLQTLHPPTMAGVADHSDYRTDSLGRLRRTSRFVSTTTFGSVATAEAAIETVRAVHARVEGVTPDGEPYSANDPHLLGWVHATEVDSFLEAKKRFGSSRVTRATADRYVTEMALVAAKLGVVDPPTSVAELADTLDRYQPELKLNRQGRSAVWFIAFPPLPLAMRGPYAVLLGGAVSSLPTWARRKLWLPKLPVTEALAVRPAALTLTRLLDWSLGAPSPTPVEEPAATG